MIDDRSSQLSHCIKAPRYLLWARASVLGLIFFSYESETSNYQSGGTYYRGLLIAMGIDGRN